MRPPSAPSYASISEARQFTVKRTGRVLLGALLSLGLIACQQEPAAPPDVYESRGVVRQLPGEGAPKAEIYIQHEAIAEFKDQDGEVVGMESMAMPFPVADDQPLTGLAVGDKVAFTFEVQWDGGHPLRLTEIAELPAATPLTFEVAAVESDADDGLADDSPPTEGGAPGGDAGSDDDR